MYWCTQKSSGEDPRSPFQYNSAKLKRKRRRSDPVLWQNPLYQQKIRKPKDNTQTPPKTSITQRLRTDLGRSVGVTSHSAGVVKPVYGYPTYPLTHQPCNQKDTHLKITINTMQVITLHLYLKCIFCLDIPVHIVLFYAIATCFDFLGFQFSGKKLPPSFFVTELRHWQGLPNAHARKQGPDPRLNVTRDFFSPFRLSSLTVWRRITYSGGYLDILDILFLLP